MDLQLASHLCGMFDYKIDNDLKMVDNTIREYYELNSVDENKKENKESEE